MSKRKIIVRNITEKSEQYYYLEKDEIHIWRIDINALKNIIFDKMFILTDKETERLNRFIHEKDRIRYACGRIYTKILAGMYLNKEPSDILIREDNFSKPYIENDNKILHHNISHSGNIVLIAFGFGVNIGVDVEVLDNTIDFKSMCRFFHPYEEKKILRSNDLRVFYKYWTAKEAYVKAAGTGFSKEPDSFYITENEQVCDEHNELVEKYNIVRINDNEKYTEVISYCEILEV